MFRHQFSSYTRNAAYAPLVIKYSNSVRSWHNQFMHTAMPSYVNQMVTKLFESFRAICNFTTVYILLQLVERERQILKKKNPFIIAPVCCHFIPCSDGIDLNSCHGDTLPLCNKSKQTSLLRDGPSLF